MSDWENLIPRPSSRFLRIRCRKCENEQIVFSHSTNQIKCRNCDETLIEPSGGKAKVHGIILATLG